MIKIMIIKNTGNLEKIQEKNTKIFLFKIYKIFSICKMYLYSSVILGIMFPLLLFLNILKFKFHFNF